MSSRRLLALAFLIPLPLLVACGSSSGDPSTAPAAAPVTAVESSSGGGGLGGAIQAGVDGIRDAGTLACDANRRALQTAVDSATMLNGTPPASQDELVGQYLVEAVPGYVIAADGTVQPLDGGPCLGH